jgi:hypothetical protein
LGLTFQIFCGGSGDAGEVLRRWSAGELGWKTFQQIAKEFAGIVIPRAWINLGRNVSLVAQKLKISPKKSAAS